jgi:branched-chain amino acid transport system permease protein
MLEILPQLLINSLITGSIYALASSGLALTYGLLRILNFAHGHLMMVGAYAFYFCVVQHDFSLFSASLCTAFFVVCLGALILSVFILPFTYGSSLLPLVTTIALGTILESVVAMEFGVGVRALPLSDSGESFEFLGCFITPIQILIVGSALIIFGVLGYVIHSTALGRRIRAISEHPQAAQSLGISRPLILLGVFSVTMLLGAYAGIMVGYETNLQPTMGSSFSLKAFAAMILGGLGNVWGTVVGALILGLIENLSIGLDFGDYSLPAGYKDAFTFLIILLVLLFRPQGLFGTRERRA